MKELLEEIELYLELIRKEEEFLIQYRRLSVEPWVFTTETIARREREIIEILIKRLNKLIDNLEVKIIKQTEFILVIDVGANDNS